MWLRSVFSLVLKPTCPLCQRTAATDCCDACWQQVQECQLTLEQQSWAGEMPLFAAGRYDGTLRRAIATLKYHNHPELAQPLGVWLADRWQASKKQRVGIPRNPVVVPIPLHADKLSTRGFNQAELLAQAFCQRTGLRMMPQALVRTQMTAAQFGLSTAAREHNVASAFAVAPGFSRQVGDRPVLLLDDIYTTGATARATCQILRKAGVPVLGMVAIARAIKAHQPASTSLIKPR